MTTAPVLAWHFVGDRLRDGRPVPKNGAWLTHDGPVEICASGLHASQCPFDAMIRSMTASTADRAAKSAAWSATWSWSAAESAAESEAIHTRQRDRFRALVAARFQEVAL